MLINQCAHGLADRSAGKLPFHFAFRSQSRIHNERTNNGPFCGGRWKQREEARPLSLSFSLRSFPFPVVQHTNTPISRRRRSRRTEKIIPLRSREPYSLSISLIRQRISLFLFFSNFWVISYSHLSFVRVSALSNKLIAKSRRFALDRCPRFGLPSRASTDVLAQSIFLTR